MEKHLTVSPEDQYAYWNSERELALDALVHATTMMLSIEREPRAAITPIVRHVNRTRHGEAWHDPPAMP
jgi:hypothetical protein